MVSSSLSHTDIKNLLTDPSPSSRAQMAKKISADFAGFHFSDSEVKLAEEIFRIMAKDAEVRVREALASQLKDSHRLPHDIALKLANDVDSVALPMLRSSEVLTDDDLVEIIQTQSEARQIAIADRPALSATISEALLSTEKTAVVSRVILNDGAEISENSLENAIEKFGVDEEIQRALLWRSCLPVSITEKLVTLFSEKMQEQLLKRHELSTDTAMELILQSRERAIVSLSSSYSENDVQDLLHHLNKNKRLTVSIILRALCMGDLRFFEASLAELAQIPLVNAIKLIYDPGRIGFERLWGRAKLPKSLFVTAMAAIEAAQELQYDGEPHDRERFSRKLIEIVLTQYDDLGVKLEADDLEYLLAKMADLPSHVDDQIRH